MLTSFEESAPDSDGLTRRGFLQVGTLGLSGLALPDLFRLRSEGPGHYQMAPPLKTEKGEPIRELVG
jgi:hypothetical protein